MLTYLVRIRKRLWGNGAEVVTPTLNIEPDPFELTDERRLVLRRVRRWVEQGFPVLVKDLTGGPLDGCVIYSVLRESYWTGSSATSTFKTFAFALELTTRTTRHIPCNNPDLQFIQLTHRGLDGALYACFLDEVNTLPKDGSGYPLPVSIQDPMDRQGCRVLAQIQGTDRFDYLASEEARLPSFTIRGGLERSVPIYYYGIDDVPITATEIRDCINQTESLLLRQLEELEREFMTRSGVIRDRIGRLRSETQYRLSAIERYEALLTKHPQLRVKPRLRQPDLVRHLDMDEYGVPRTRDQLAAWLDNRNPTLAAVRKTAVASKD